MSVSEPSIAELIAARAQLAMHAMDGLLLEGVPLNRIADVLGTPTWVYGAGTMRQRFAVLRDAVAGLREAGLAPHIHYAIKANDHLAVLRVFGAEGAGADVVSGGELRRARQAGIPGEKIVFSGVGKTAEELRLALVEGVAQINVESAEELEMLSAVATTVGRTAPLALRINPDIAADTHAKISTGRSGDKFGIPLADVAALYGRAVGLPGVRPVGLAVHIGSQIQALGRYRAAYGCMAGLVRDLRAQGLMVEVVDCGGGLAIPYGCEPVPSPRAFAGVIAATLGGLGLKIIFEPGRWLVGPAGVLLASVVLEKRLAERRFVVLDAAMNDLIRPALYDAWHGIVPLSAVDAARPTTQADVVGPVCETGDTFARNRALPPLARNARVAMLDAGAYGAVMSSTYNARPLAAAAMVDGDRWAVIRERGRPAALWAGERIPDFLA